MAVLNASTSMPIPSLRAASGKFRHRQTLCALFACHRRLGAQLPRVHAWAVSVSGGQCGSECGRCRWPAVNGAPLRTGRGTALQNFHTHPRRGLPAVGTVWRNSQTRLIQIASLRGAQCYPTLATSRTGSLLALIIPHGAPIPVRPPYLATASASTTWRLRRCCLDPAQLGPAC